MSKNSLKSEGAKLRKLEYNRRWRAANPDKVRKQQRDSYAKHATTIYERRKNSPGYLAKKRITNRRSRLKNIDKVKQRAKDYYAKNKDRVNTKAAKWAKANRDKRRKSSRDWHKRNPEAHFHIALRTKYRLTPDQYAAMWDEQRGLCAVCLRPELSKNGRLSVDHCHSTNGVRGLLCVRCNSAIGLLGDTAESLVRALKYLQAFESRTESRCA